MTKNTNLQESSRKVLNVSISQDAFNKLEGLAEREGIKKWMMLSRMLIQSRLVRNQRYKVNNKWDSRLLNPRSRTIKYKGTTGNKQISYYISESAWNKLECHKTAQGLSKARIVQSIITDYSPTSETHRERLKQARMRIQENAEQWLSLYQIPHEIKAPSKFIHVGDGNYLHAKGIEAEEWDDSEIVEHENLTNQYLLAR